MEGVQERIFQETRSEVEREFYEHLNSAQVDRVLLAETIQKAGFLGRRNGSSKKEKPPFWQE
jgi:hypothetical protein